MANWMYPDYEYEGAEEDQDEHDYVEYYEDYDYAQLDLDDPDGDTYDYYMDDAVPSISMSELTELCIFPTLESVPDLMMMLAWVIIFTAFTRIVRTFLMRHILSILSGGALLYQLFEWRLLYIVGQIVTCVVAITFSVALMSRKHCVWFVSLACTTYLLVCELWFVDATAWHSIRGAQMIVLMKIISYVNDIYDPYIKSKDGEKTEEEVLDNITDKEESESKPGLRKRIKSSQDKKVKKSGSFSKADRIDRGKDKLSTEEELQSDGLIYRTMELLGYILHPGTVIFGPWCSIESYRGLLEPLDISLVSIVGILSNVVLSCLFLVCSTCVISWLIPDDSNRWILAYRDASSFRFSHYFVSHLSEASLSLGGLSATVVSRAQHIELPRSLLSVVTYWNRPMHQFLKKYVFMRVKSLCGSLIALICTYSASALIHGINGQLCAVLLSLAIYTHAEHLFRTKVAEGLSACVLAKPCPQPCGTHKNTANAPITLLFNVIMGALCVWHLAYLGVMFDSEPSGVSGYSITHTLQKWSRLDFLSHKVIMLIYFVTALI